METLLFVVQWILELAPLVHWIYDCLLGFKNLGAWSGGRAGAAATEEELESSWRGSSQGYESNKTGGRPSPLPLTGKPGPLFQPNLG